MISFDDDLVSSSKNLLAFSAGVDSSALFFILLKKNIDFDIAIVDYNQRKQSKDEISYAEDLAKKYNKKIFIRSYNEEKFSEKYARDFRYNFFDEIILNNNYRSLITAHQLNDKLEWFLMQFTKGAGLIELMGLNKKTQRKNYTIYKPLLDISRDEIFNYLKVNDIKYFIDTTNDETIYKRNYFRKEFSNKLLNGFENGIKDSFKYLNLDIQSLNNIKSSFHIEQLTFTIFYNDDINLIIRYIDKELKKYGIVISSLTRQEIARQKNIVVSHSYSIDIVDNYVFIAPYIQNITLSKKFKEFCRINKIPKNIRGYLYTQDKNIIDNFIQKLDINLKKC